MLQLFFVKNA